MGARELRNLLDDVADTRELVLRRTDAAGPAWDAVYAAWNDAHEDAECAFGFWTRCGGVDAYAAYRAAQDREDAAQDALCLAVADERVPAAVPDARVPVSAR